MNKSKSNIDSIEEGEGLGVLKFGLQRSDVELLLGKPDEKKNYSYTKGKQDLTEYWSYDDLELSLGFGLAIENWTKS